ncbi:uncharacterized protein LOC131536961 [Onychostoma macrolepis]|uniref:uncharacterized protein LOC131536961 n=1 Tax=Onychostoma macrolepis TaxID=369639 RepID=UPI00272A6E09|nr:uncharacterized protein LOC131536961 [Onychostoma macrolepis]XP_058626168.1 uncharacterized protein LOC131536961 [Onychostoma macrolepis]
MYRWCLHARLVSARTAGIPKPAHCNPPVPIPLSEALPLMGIALGYVWAAYTTAELSEVAAAAAASPEVVAGAAEPPEAAGLTSAPCMVVAPSNVLSTCCVTNLSLCPEFTAVEPPEVAATAAEPPEVSAVSVCKISSCPGMAMEAVNELSFCPVTAMEINYELPVFPASVLGSVHVLSPFYVSVLPRSQALLWVPDPSWWAPALSAPPWWSSGPSAPLWWSSAPPWWAPALSVPLWWSAVWLWWSSAPPWWAPVLSAPPWWAPIPSSLPWLPALPWSPVTLLPQGPGPPSLPLFRLRSTSLLDYRLCGASGSRSLGGGALSRIWSLHFRSFTTRGHSLTTLTLTAHITLDSISHHPLLITAVTNHSLH